MVATIKDLDDALNEQANSLTSLKDAIAKLDKSVDAAIDKYNKGNDLSSQLNAMKKNTAAIDEALATVAATDAKDDESESPGESESPDEPTSPPVELPVDVNAVEPSNPPVEPTLGPGL